MELRDDSKTKRTTSIFFKRHFQWKNHQHLLKLLSEEETNISEWYHKKVEEELKRRGVMCLNQ